MGEFTYDFPDTTSFLYTLRSFLESSNELELSALLAGAKCEFSSSNDFSHVRWNSYSASIIFRVSVDNLPKVTTEVKEKLLDFADRVMPPEAGYDLQYIDVVPHLLIPPSQEVLSAVSVELAMLRGRYNPVFGEPSTDVEFQCDIFMVMPFKPEFEPTYRQILLPTVNSLGLTMKRGDDPFSKHEIMYEIWSMLNACEVVIADYSGLNPNVFYEVGIAHTIGKPVIAITKDISTLPFDLRSWRTIEYDTAFDKVGVFKDKLAKAIRSLFKLQEEIEF